ncbi:MAG: bile acid:sodium symporter [Verrucomicrobiota bacterium]
MGQDEVINIAISAIVFTTMIVIGLDLTLDDFRKLFSKPKALLVGLLGLFLLVPASIAFVRLTNLPPHLDAGILLVAICPTGNFSNVYTYVGKANTALSITLSVTTALMAFVTMPLWIWAYSFLLDEKFTFEVPASALFVRLFFLLAIPVGLGIFIRTRFPAFERKCRRVMKHFTLVAILLLGGYIIVSDGDGFAEDFGPTALAAIILTFISMTVGYTLARVSRLDKRDARTLTVVFPVKNLGIAIAVAVSIFHQTEFAVFATAMFMTQVPILLAISLLFRRFPTSSPRSATSPPPPSLRA